MDDEVTDEEIAILPTERDMDHYQRRGWYLSEKLFTDDEVDELAAATDAYYAGYRDRELPAGPKRRGLTVGGRQIRLGQRAGEAQVSQRGDGVEDPAVLKQRNEVVRPLKRLVDAATGTSGARPAPANDVGDPARRVDENRLPTTVVDAEVDADAPRRERMFARG